MIKTTYPIRRHVPGQDYTDQGQDYYEERYRQRVLLNLSRRSQQLGMRVVAIEQPV